MKKFLICLFILLSSLEVFAKNRIKLVIITKVHNDYLTFLDGRNPQEITDFHWKSSRRGIAETVLIQQALRLGGMTAPIHFTKAPSAKRVTQQLLDGKAHISATSMLGDVLRQHEETIFSSIAVVDPNEFVVGFYTHPTNQRALASKNIHDLRQLTGLSSRSWTSDWNTLQTLGFEKVRHTGNWKSMVKMLGKNRADFLLASFPNTQNMTINTLGVTLIPIPNLKIGIMDSRHFGVTKRSYRGREIIQAVNKGLSILKERGVIRRAFRESGFFNYRVDDWKLVNDEVSTAE